MGNLVNVRPEVNLFVSMQGWLLGCKLLVGWTEADDEKQILRRLFYLYWLQPSIHMGLNWARCWVEKFKKELKIMKLRLSLVKPELLLQPQV